MSDQHDTLQNIITTIQPENHIGILLAAQMGGTPQEIQLIVQTGEMDEEHEAMQTTGQYIIRCIGVEEHQLSLGLFGNLVISQDNPLLYAYNEKIMQVHFSGMPEDVDGLMIDLNQLYGQTYGIFDPFRRMAMEINPTKPLATILESGGDVLGVMPEPFASKVAGVLQNRHGLESKLVEIKPEHESDHHNIKYQSLIIDDSFVIAQMFSADPMRGKN